MQSYIIPGIVDSNVTSFLNSSELEKSNACTVELIKSTVTFTIKGMYRKVGREIILQIAWSYKEDAKK